VDGSEAAIAVMEGTVSAASRRADDARPSNALLFIEYWVNVLTPHHSNLE
jgi:hypothetical protein